MLRCCTFCYFSNFLADSLGSPKNTNLKPEFLQTAVPDPSVPCVHSFAFSDWLDGKPDPTETHPSPLVCFSCLALCHLTVEVKLIYSLYCDCISSWYLSSHRVCSSLHKSSHLHVILTQETCLGNTVQRRRVRTLARTPISALLVPICVHILFHSFRTQMASCSLLYTRDTICFLILSVSGLTIILILVL